MSRLIDGAVAVAANDLPWTDIGRVGIKLRDMSFRDPANGMNVRVAIGFTSAEGFSPRHRHTFEQIRYFVDGPARFGDTIYKPGDCVYFPEGVPYGPQRGHNDEDSLHVTLQFSGPSGIYYPSPEEQQRAQRELAAVGTFEGGMYIDASGTKRDVFEATLEQLTHLPVHYPEQRYDHPVRMRVPAFEPEALGGDERVALRRLATFNEVGPVIRFIDAAAGAELPGGVQPFTEIRLLVRGAVRFEGATYDAQSCFFLPLGAPFGATAATADAQLLCVRFGRAAVEAA